MTGLAHRRNHDFDVALYWDTPTAADMETV